MSAIMESRRGTGRPLVGLLVGALVGAASPLLLALASVVFAAPVLTARLYVYAGLWAALSSCAAQLLMGFLCFGGAGAALVFLGMIVPLVLTLRLLRAGTRTLPELLRLTIPAWMFCAALAVTLAYLLAGMNLADYAAGRLGNWLKALPAGVADQLLAVMSGRDVPKTLNLLTMYIGFSDPAERARAIASLVEALRNGIALWLPGILLSASALTALLATAWPCRCLANAGEIPQSRWLPVRTWHLPGSMTVCLLALYAGALVAVNVSDAAAARPVCATVERLALLAFRVQAVGSLERRLSAGHMRTGGRAALIALFVLFPYLSAASFYYGIGSALFGNRYGVVTRYLRERRGGGDDGEGGSE